LPFSHLLLALGVVAAWAFNFVAIKVGLADLPPLFMAAVRFVLTAIPFVFFIRPPKAPPLRVVAYGLLTFTLQFAFLFTGMTLGVSPAMAALVLQVSAFVTIGLAAVVWGERLNAMQVVGAVVAVSGLVIIGLHIEGDSALPGLLMVLLAAASWGAGNVVGKSIGKVDMLALVVWAGLVPPLPLFALSLWLEGPHRIVEAGAHLTLIGALGVAYVVYISTHLGYTAYAWLLSRHPAATVAPFTMLVPPLAAVFSALALGETFPAWKLGAGALVLAGVVINLFGPRLVRKLAAPAAAR
jgi:O-acetylserine/cysteine efflux transporter